jgi:hypothetical protein
MPARDEESTLGLASFGNLVIYDSAAVQPFFAALHKRLVDLDGGTKADLSLPCIVARFQLELSLALEDGKLDPAELTKMRPCIEALGELIDGLRERLSVRAA